VPVKLEAFLSIEDSFTQRLSSEFLRVSAPILREAQKRLLEGHYDDAERVIRTLDLTPVVTTLHPAIVFLSKVAMLFGASRVNRSPGTSRVGLGFEDELLEQNAKAFERAITVSLRDRVVASAVQLIAIERAKESTPEEGTYLGSVFKAGKEPGLLPFESFVSKQGTALFKTASSLHTSRLASFGFTSEARYLGITSYKITERLDARTCPVCQQMHGKQFRVEQARALLDIVIRTQDPEELKTLQPWPKQSPKALEAMAEMTPDQLVGMGWHIPPFHPRCRGLLDAVERVKPLGEIETEETYNATPAEFAQYGAKFSPTKVKLWNSVMQAPVSDVLGAMLSLPPEQVLQKSIEGSLSGLKTLSATSSAINIETSSLMPDGVPVSHDLYFRKDKSLYIGSIDIGKPTVAALRFAMKIVYKSAKATAMDSIRMISEGGVEGWAFAKYGFSPSAAGWKNLKASIMADPDKLSVINSTTGPMNTALSAIFKSDDPRDVFALADLKLGKKLLTGTSWEGVLELAHPESMVRFLSTVAA
jgi:hypothetical protein